MGKVNKEEQARRDGMQFALRVAESGGIEALRRECQIRGVQNVPVGIKEKELNEFAYNVKLNTLDCLTIMGIAVLIDEFDFTEEQCSRFKQRFNLKADCICGDYASWEDIKAQIEEDIDMKLEIRANDRHVTIEG